MSVAAYPLARERNLILAGLLGLAGASWVALVSQQRIMDQTYMGLTMGMTAPLFLGIWVLMMVAMMFPAAAPMILVFNRVQTDRRQRDQAFVGTWVFVISYLFVWTAFGALAFVAAALAQTLADRWPLLMEQAPRIAGATIVLAGLYQLSPLKRLCLDKCRTPMTFIMTSWRDGTWGAVRMGVEHGAFCLGCCWMLFVILFPLGVMNVAAMAVITVFIFAEKSLPFPEVFRQGAMVLLIGLGIALSAGLAIPGTPFDMAGMTAPLDVAPANLTPMDAVPAAPTPMAMPPGMQM